MTTKSLAQLRNGLHFSASALKSFLICPWKFRLQYVEGAVPEFRPSTMILGSAVHQALALYHKGLQVQEPLPLAEIRAQFDMAISTEAQSDVPIQFKNGETEDDLRQVGMALVELYCEEAKPKTILAVEQPFKAKLVDPATGELLEPQLVGVFDLVEADDEGTVSVVEIKTAARKWSASQVDLDLQGSLYAEAIAQAGMVPEGQEALIRYEILVKNKKPLLDSKSAVRRPGDRKLAVTIAVDVLRAIELDAFYRNPGWQCAGCQHRKQCGI